MKKILFLILLFPFFVKAQTDPAPTGATQKNVTNYQLGDTTYIFQNSKWFSVVNRAQGDNLFIQNRSTSQQPNSSFWISGQGIIGTTPTILSNWLSGVQYTPTTQNGVLSSQLIEMLASPTANTANSYYGQYIHSVAVTNVTMGLVGGLFARSAIRASATVTSAPALTAASPFFNGTGAITNAYGLYLQPQFSVASGTPWAVYAPGQNDFSLFGGNVGVGGASPPGSSFVVTQQTTGEGAATVTSGSATVTGATNISGAATTNFTNTFRTGDNITIAGQTRVVQTVTNDLSLTVTANFTANSVIPPPQLLQLTASTGTLTAGTYYFVVTAVNGSGQTTKSNEVSIVLSATGGVQVQFSPVIGAVSYNVYRGTTPGGENVFQNTTNYQIFIDHGAGTSGTPPVTNSALGPGAYTLVGGDVLVAKGNGNVQFPRLQSITAVNQLGVDANGNVGLTTGGSGSVTGASNGIVDSLGIVQLSTGASGFLNKVTVLKDADNTAIFQILPSRSAPGINLAVVALTGAHTGGAAGLGLSSTAATFLYGVVSSSNSLIFSSTGNVMADQLGDKGIVYANNYGVNFSARSLIDKNYVDSTRLVDVPSQTGNIGDYLTTNGTNTSWAPVSATTANAVTFNNSGAGATSPTTFNGSVARTISYNTIGAQVAGSYLTAIGVTTANGVSGASSGGTTPNLTISLGNITPTTISTTIKPSTVYQTPSGTAGTDSVMVKHIGGVVEAISPTFYATASSVPTGANPTATIGLTAVNGSAATFNRSDGAPALSQGIVPTWTGIHTFSAAPVFNALPTGTAVASAPTASTIMTRDANANEFSNNSIQNGQSIATTGGTTTLTVSSPQLTIFTGTNTQGAQLPAVSGLTLYQKFLIIDNSTGNVTVQSSGGNNVQIMSGGSYCIFTCILTSGTTAASWQVQYIGSATGAYMDLTTNQTAAGNKTFSGTTTFNGNTVMNGLNAIGSMNNGGSTNNLAFLNGSDIAANKSDANLQFGGSSTVAVGLIMGGSYGAIANISTGNNYGKDIIGGAPTATNSGVVVKWGSNFVVNPIGTITFGGGGSALTNSTSMYINGQSTQGTNNYNLVSYSPGSTTTNIWAKYGTTRVSGLQVDSAATFSSSITGQVPVLATITGINAKSTGTTALYTVPTGKTLTVTGVYVTPTAASSITVGPSADVGVTAGDVYANTAMTTLTTTGKVFQYVTGGVYSTSASTAVLNFNINTAATGTSETLTVTVTGYLQ